ncbi:MAG TPA: FAD-dependent oxidoreductase, partial [Patescibacteria group bacterium]
SSTRFLQFRFSTSVSTKSRMRPIRLSSLRAINPNLCIKIFNNKTNEEKVMAVDGVFVAIGHEPATGFVKEIVELKETGHIKTGFSKEYKTMTSKEGIFAAGDCVDDIYRQAIAAAGDGCKAGLDADRWLSNKK